MAESSCQAERLTTAEAASYLSVSIPTLRRWTKAGLPAIRKGQRWVRYARADLDRWLVDHRVGSSDSQAVPGRIRSASGYRPSVDKSSLERGKAGFWLVREQGSDHELALNPWSDQHNGESLPYSPCGHGSPS